LTRRTNRLFWIGAIGLVLAFSIGLSMFALRSGIAFALSPSELYAAELKPGQRVRLFGLVEEGSVKKGEGLNVRFDLTDNQRTISVVFSKILPDLFREKQGIITEGVMGSDGVFQADTVLAKHDENYMPEGMAKTLREKGVWQGDEY